MRKLAALVILGALAFFPAAQAQNSEAPPESRIAAAIDMLKATNAIGNMGAVLGSLEPIQRAELRREAPGLSDEVAQALVKKMNAAILAREDELLRLFGILYASRFSEQELRDLTTFYRSDLGAKYIAQIPGLLKESGPLMSRWAIGVVEQELEEILKSIPQQDRKT